MYPACRRLTPEIKVQDMLVDALVCLLLDPGSSPGTSTKQPNTKILSDKSLGDMKAGAFVVLRVNSVLRDAIRAVLTPRQPADALPRIHSISHPPHSLFGRSFSVFSGLGQVSPQLSLSTSL